MIRRLSLLVLVLAGGRALAAETDTVQFPAGCIQLEPDGPRSRCTDAYAIDRTEVTVEAFARCVRAGACENPCSQGNCSCLCNSAVPGRGRHPMNCVSYSDAESYCRWNGQRLPTEAEWDKVAISTYGDWLDSAVPACDSVHRGRCELPAGASIGRPNECVARTEPVCSPRLGNTPGGICDLAGNVREFVSDWWALDRPRRPPIRREVWNPVGPVCASRQGDDCLITLRGGSYETGETLVPWLAVAEGLPMTTIQPSFQLTATGFRCVTAGAKKRNGAGAPPATATAALPAKPPEEPPPILPREDGPVIVPATCVSSRTSLGWKVCLDAFAIDKNEVTVTAYQRCVDAGLCRKACNKKPTCSTECNASGPGRENHPVNCVSVDDAQAYCRWNRQRLPLDVEWEVATLGPTAQRRKYPWGDETETCDRVTRQGCAVPGEPASAKHEVLGTAPVCSNPRGHTPAGMCDAAGNVAEWTLAWACDWMANRKKWTRRLRGRQWIPREAPSRIEAMCERHIGLERLKGGSYLEYESYLGFPAREFGVDVAKQRPKLPWLEVPAVGFRCVTDTKSAQTERHKP